MAFTDLELALGHRRLEGEQPAALPGHRGWWMARLIWMSMLSAYCTGEGGAKVVPVALRLLKVFRAWRWSSIDIREGGAIGYPAAKEISGAVSRRRSTNFADEIGKANGVLFCGPGGDRFVYQLRKAFDLSVSSRR